MKLKISRTILILFILNFAAIPAYSDDLREAPSDVAAALLVKLLAFEKNLTDTDKIIIYVLSDYDMAEHLGKAVGKKVGKSTVTEIQVGTQVPKEKYSVIFVGDDSKRDECIKYSRANDILSVTRNPEQVTNGVSLGISIGRDNKPKVVINLTASAEEGLDWNPAILKSAKIVK